MSAATTKRSVHDLAQACLLAVQEARRRALVCQAWDLLQERSEEGQVNGPLPYTGTALPPLLAAHAGDREDIGIIHHLAITHHARAWDLELAGDPTAATYWQQALGYWRVVSTSAEFWSGLDRRFTACAAEGEVSPLPDLRKHLLEHLLEVHVDFVRRYGESSEAAWTGGAKDRASIHVEIVRRARIPLAVRRLLIQKIFEDMTASVPVAKVQGDYASALLRVERFLDLVDPPGVNAGRADDIGDHLGGLRLHAEISGDWVSGRSYKDDWDLIVGLSERSRPYAERLLSHPDLASDPQAWPAVEAMAQAFGRHANSRGSTYFNDDLPGEGAKAFEIGISWGRLVIGRCSAASDVRNALGVCLLGHSACLGSQIQDIQSRDIRLRYARQALAECTEGSDAGPTLPGLREGLEGQRAMFQEFVNELESRPQWEHFR
jgi:hypothetical protein